MSDDSFFLTISLRYPMRGIGMFTPKLSFIFFYYEIKNRKELYIFFALYCIAFVLLFV